MRERTENPEPTTPAIYMAHLARVVGRWGITPGQLLESTGVTMDELASPDARITESQSANLALRALALTGEPGLGFYHGLEVKLAAHGALGLAVMTSASLEEAMFLAERFVQLRSNHLSFSHVIEGDEIAFEIEETRSLGDLRVFLLESLLTSFIQVPRLLVGHPVSGRVDVTYSEPAHFQGFAHLWPGPTRFSRPTNRLVFPKAVLDEPIVMADTFAAQKAVSDCERELATLGETSSLLARVRRQMKARSLGFPSLTELAATQHVSPRTLKRRLAGHGTSFQTLLDELRRDRAIALLEDDATSIERVAEVLGYADPSNFNRAFRRWMASRLPSGSDAALRAERAST